MKQDITRELCIKSLNEEDDYFYFEGMASTFGNVDFDNDVILPGAFTDSISKNQQIPILWQHSWGEPIGVSVELKESEQGLHLKGKLPKSDTFVSGRVYPQLKVGSVRKMSIGFSMGADDYSYDENSLLRVIKKVDLKETSIVTFPANDMADIHSVKSLPDFQSVKDLEKFLRSSCNMSRKMSEAFISKSKLILLNQGDPDQNKKNDQSDPDSKEKELQEIKQLIKLMRVKQCLKT